MTRPHADTALELRGLVVATGWDEGGAPTRVALLTAGEDEYSILPDAIGSRLAALVRREVVVRGVLVPSAEGPSSLEVLSFAPTESPPCPAPATVTPSPTEEST